ncbi:unnamed protein product [Amoebophrya sp. A120]|nr:unnamed protein product [Amoebophrya sp. A120]|eukprot:GSA120T00006150001.1
MWSKYQDEFTRTIFSGRKRNHLYIKMKAVLHTSCVSAVLGQLGGLQMPPLSGSLSTPPPSAGPMGVQMPPGMMGGGGAAPPQGRPSIAIGPMLSPNGQPIGGQEMPQGTNVVANAMAASSMGGGAPGLVGNAGQIDPLQKMMNEMMQSPDLDGKVCAGVPRKQTNVGKECWENIWAFVGCKKENSPQYEQWHAAQSLEILAIDALQWAHLDDPKHKDACYGNNGPPAPQAPQGLSGSMLMGGQGGAPSGGGMAGMPPLGGAGPGQMQMPQQQQPPASIEIEDFVFVVSVCAVSIICAKRTMYVQFVTLLGFLLFSFLVAMIETVARIQIPNKPPWSRQSRAPCSNLCHRCSKRAVCSPRSKRTLAQTAGPRPGPPLAACQRRSHRMSSGMRARVWRS